MHRDAFGSFHPLVVFAFFIAAIVLCVITNSPLFQVTGVICAVAYYLCTHGMRAWKTIAALVPLYLLIMVVNPIFNTQGDTVLFRVSLLGDRPYTLEALAYGSCTASMFVSALLWFFSYNKVMTTDKFTYLFGGLSPALSLVFTMVLRLVPTYQRKAEQIISARSCIGHTPTQGAWHERAAGGMTALSSLVTWALEGAIVTSDSMRSRGYGTARRSSYARYDFTTRDAILLGILAILFAGALACILMGAATVEYFPGIVFPSATPVFAGGFIAYLVFLAAPTLMHGGEVLSWRSSLSKI